MAITKKKAATSTRRRKTGAKAGRKRKTRSVKGLTTPDTITISGIGRYKKSTCHKTKTDAKKTAESARSKGRKARVIKSGTGYCVYTRGAARKRA